MISRRRLATTAYFALLTGCSNNEDPPQPVIYDTWLYDSDEWYDDEFWRWLDEQDDEDIDRDDIRNALRGWYDGLDPADQESATGSRTGSRTRISRRWATRTRAW